MGIEDVGKMATSGIKDTFGGDIMKGAGEMLAAPLQLFSKGDDKKSEEQQQQAQPIIINIINEAKGKEEEEKTKGASASASAVAG